MHADLEGPRKIVLLVDDAPEMLGAVIEALESAGLTVLVARDGASALALLDRVTPDLVLLDAIMPGLDGFETCRRIKARPALGTTPVVFMTGLSEPEHVLAGLRAGGVDYVGKPIDPDVLIARITIHVANAEMINEARQALDVGGGGVVAFSFSGDEQDGPWTLTWATPQAALLLGAQLDEKTRAALQVWLGEASVKPVSACPTLSLRAEGARPALALQSLGTSAGGDVLARVAEDRGLAPPELLSRELGLSAREGEVLNWLAKGKSNKDIAAILQLSPRTVTKHLETIFQKLGVENRTAAAVIALRTLTP